MKHLLALLLAAQLCACANGVVMTDEETVNCRTVGCAAFSENEIRALIGKVYKDGYLSGWGDANKQAGRNL